MTDSRRKYEALVEALPDRDKRLLACRIARWALTEFEVENPLYWEAVEVSTRYAEGLATLEELSAARAAAGRAARAAARAAQAAAEEASWGAARSARLAAWAAVWSAEEAAASAAEAADWAVDAAVLAAYLSAWDASRDSQEAAVAATRDARDATYKMLFEMALCYAIGEEVSA